MREKLPGKCGGFFLRLLLLLGICFKLRATHQRLLSLEDLDNVVGFWGILNQLGVFGCLPRFKSAGENCVTC
jgi:hypothetical protein